MKIIDSIGPFFINCKKEVYNWSKVPFESIKPKDFPDIKKAFIKYIKKVKSLGYDSISIDDLAHLLPLDIYPKSLRLKIAGYQKLYNELFKEASKLNLDIYINTDLMFFNKYIKRKIRLNGKKKFLKEYIIKTFEFYQKYNIKGIIFRIGEQDGVDVKGDFKSKIIIKHPKQLSKYLKELIPVFEKYKKYIIIRTWTIGIHEIGDLIWNKKTYDQSFNIDSPYLIISMKYGQGDFFRNLPLNPLFFTKHKKIIELQTRMEYDGFGDLPYYVGWDYNKYLKQLKSANLVGIHTWCQTGGWNNKKSLTFIKNSSIWNELNTKATIDIYNKKSPEYPIEKILGKDYITYIKEYNNISNKILYPKKLFFFRRVMAPPILWLQWDNITINAFTKAYFYLGNKKENINLNNFKKISQKLKADTKIIKTLELFYNCRKLLEGDKADISNTNSYKISIDKKENRLLHYFLRIFIRKKQNYRFIDHILLTKIMSKFQLWFISLFNKYKPEFLNNRAIHFKKLFK